jgi:hypothetical protein
VTDMCFKPGLSAWRKVRAGLLSVGLFGLSGLALFPRSAEAGEGMWSLSLRIDGEVDFKPGNDLMMGPEIAYSSYWLGQHQFQIKGAYLTNRLEEAFRNILAYDYFLVTPLWHFRRSALFDPTLQVNLGYARFDIENEEIFGDLDNDTWIAALQPGLNLNFSQGRWGLHWHFGYNFIAPEGHVIYPGVFGLELWWML